MTPDEQEKVKVAIVVLRHLREWDFNEPLDSRAVWNYRYLPQVVLALKMLEEL